MSSVPITPPPTAEATEWECSCHNTNTERCAGSICWCWKIENFTSPAPSCQVEISSFAFVCPSPLRFLAAEIHVWMLLHRALQTGAARCLSMFKPAGTWKHPALPNCPLPRSPTSSLVDWLLLLTPPITDLVSSLIFDTCHDVLLHATHGLLCITLGFGVLGGACSHSLSLQRHVHATQHMGSGVSHWGLAFRVGHVHILCHCNVMFMLRNTWALVFHIGVWRFGWGMFTFFVTATSCLCYATHGLWCFTLGFGVSGGACSHSLSLQRHVYATQHMGSGVSHWGLAFRVGHVHILCHCNVMFMLRNTWALVFHIGVWRFGWGMFTFFVTATSCLCYATHGLWCITLGFGVSGFRCGMFKFFVTATSCLCYATHGLWCFTLGFGVSGFRCGMFKFFVTATSCLCYASHGLWCFTLGFGVSGGACSHSLSLQRHVYATQHMGSGVSHWGLAFRVGNVPILCHCNVMFMLRNTWALVYHIGVWGFGLQVRHVHGLCRCHVMFVLRNTWAHVCDTLVFHVLSVLWK